uniref:Uncharacterized protein n=1 Tax=Pristionchus pacificus TaxID=54126 RepID=A0A2A6C4B6_PRIPA|eukprot:PDM72966.1 hypothetical protein PRIPAC_39400 [Pristionchus pacificus]
MEIITIVFVIQPYEVLGKSVMEDDAIDNLISHLSSGVEEQKYVTDEATIRPRHTIIVAAVHELLQMIEPASMNSVGEKSEGDQEEKHFQWID